MFALSLALPLAAALLCQALNRVVPTRWLGLGAAAVLLIVAALLVIARVQAGLPLVIPERVWALLDQQSVRLALRLDGASWPFALLQMLGGAVGLIALALAIPATLRGFGGLFAAVLLVLQATLLGLANTEPLLLAFAWALAALFSFVALRVSGAAPEANSIPISLVAGLLGALLLLAATLVSPAAGDAPPVVLVCWALLALLAIGAPPFHAAVDQHASAPAALAGLLLALGLPLLGIYALMRFAASQASLPTSWRVCITLLGLLTLLVCAAGATNTSQIRRLLGWQFSAQLGLVLMAVGQGGDALNVAAPALLSNAALTTLACTMAVAVLERRAGTDDLAAIGMPGPLTLPGLAFLIAAASAVGLPGTWGFWPRRWLIDTLLSAAPWAVPLLLSGTLLMALAYIAPVAAFWRGDTPSDPNQPAPGRGRPALLALISPAIAALPLLIAGIAPQLAWRSWLDVLQTTLVPDDATRTPALPGLPTQIAFGAAALAFVALPFIIQRGRSKAAPPDTEAQSAGLLVPQALGQSLQGLSALGMPDTLFRAAWAALLSLSRTIRQLLALFEQRYYLAGMLIALIVVIMLLI
jgi:formate hydrogenlyase subunit 3/multisubunit Na+/H+ antiporter MnhD subunit